MSQRTIWFNLWPLKIIVQICRFVYSPDLKEVKGFFRREKLTGEFRLATVLQKGDLYLKRLNLKQRLSQSAIERFIGYNSTKDFTS